jgi:hypothetical protein
MDENANEPAASRDEIYREKADLEFRRAVWRGAVRIIVMMIIALLAMMILIR